MLLVSDITADPTATVLIIGIQAAYIVVDGVGVATVGATVGDIGEATEVVDIAEALAEGLDEAIAGEPVEALVEALVEDIEGEAVGVAEAVGEGKKV